MIGGKPVSGMRDGGGLVVSVCDARADIRTTILVYVRSTFMPLHAEGALTPASDLQALGVLDSLSFLDLVAKVEALFGVDISDDEMLLANVISIDTIAQSVERLQTVAQCR